MSQPFEKFSLAFQSEVCETTNFTSSGYQTNEAGVFSCALSADGPYNGSSGLTQGQSIAITLAVGGGGPSFAITFRIENQTIDCATRNAVARYAITGKSNGTYSVTF